MRISQLIEDGLLEIGAIHTYIELYSRLVVDLIPNVVLSAGFMADRQGNIYTGPSTEDSPALIEPAAFSDGIVIVQVNELVDDVSELPVSIFLLLGLIMWWWRISHFISNRYLLVTRNTLSQCMCLWR